VRSVPTRPLWDPEQYGRFADERSRPFFDLLAEVDFAPRSVVDLGCGTGALTASLLERWPEATVTGVDNSAAMIERAASLSRPGRLEFVLDDLAQWEPPGPVDLIVSNAALHWVPDHRRLLPRLAARLATPGVLAFQVPGNFGEPSHLIIHELCDTERWRNRLGTTDDSPRQEAAVAEPADYLRDLIAAGLVARVWETTYLHVLEGVDPVLEWMKGTALRPALDALGPDPARRAAFLADLDAVLQQRYPPGPHGTLFPFRRVFVVAHRA